MSSFRPPIDRRIWKDVAVSAVMVLVVAAVCRLGLAVTDLSISQNAALLPVRFLAILFYFVPFSGYDVLFLTIFVGLFKARSGFVLGPVLLVTVLGAAEAVQYWGDGRVLNALVALSERPKDQHDLVVFDGEDYIKTHDCLSFLTSSINHRIAYSNTTADRRVRAEWIIHRYKQDGDCGLGEKGDTISDGRGTEIQICKSNSILVDLSNAIIYKTRTTINSRVRIDERAQWMPPTFEGRWAELVESDRSERRVLSVMMSGRRAFRWIALVKWIPGEVDAPRVYVNIDLSGTHSRACSLASTP